MKTTTDKSFQSLSDYFLIAMPQLDDPFFSGSVVYLCEHTPEGAMGLVINKPSPLQMNQLFDSIEEKTPIHFAEQWVLMGGPIQVDRGFLLHSPVGNWQSSLIVNDDIAITTSRDIIEKLATVKDKNDIKLLVTIGYCSWGEGQLEQELNDNSWLVTPADNNVLFELPYFKRYQAALKSLGIDKAVNISSGIGHA